MNVFTDYHIPLSKIQKYMQKETGLSQERKIEKGARNYLYSTFILIVEEFF